MNYPNDTFIKTTADGRLLKINVDYTTAVDELLKTTDALVKDKKIDQAIEDILALEKKTRLESDAIQTGRLLEELIRVLCTAKDWPRLNAHLILMTKKRGQLKQAVVKMVQKASEFLDVEGLLSRDQQVDLIRTLRTVTEGKIYVELERARLTLRLAKMLENEASKLDEVVNILLDIQVETLGSMKKEEKFSYILEQMRMCLAKGDYVQTQILSEKISRKIFENADGEAAINELKLKFYNLMLEMEVHEENYLNISKNCWEMFSITGLGEDKSREALKEDTLKQVILFLVLAPFSHEKHDLLHRRKENRALEKIPLYSDLLDTFTIKEIIDLDEFNAKYLAELDKQANNSLVARITSDKLKETLEARLIEHNIRIIAGYYTQIRFKRMAELIRQPEDVTEEFLSKLVIDKTIVAKIDRLASVVHFTPKMQPVDVLNAWGDNISTVITLISKSTHLINKERMIHAV